MQVRWTRQALADRAGIVDYLLPLNPYAAKAVAQKLVDATTDLAFFPRMGREGIDNTREWPVVTPYVIIYKIDEQADTVRILRVWHTAQAR